MTQEPTLAAKETAGGTGPPHSGLGSDIEAGMATEHDSNVSCPPEQKRAVPDRSTCHSQSRYANEDGARTGGNS